MTAEIPATMRAMRLVGPRPVGERPLELTDLPVPAPGPGEVLMRVRACGVCRTDLHVVEGELPPHRSPVVPGHQIVAEVVGFGEGAAAVSPGGETAAAPLRLGERVGVPWLHETCGECRFCRSDRENLCEHPRFTGYDVDGGFAEYAVAPAAFVYRLPESMEDLHAAPLLCAGIIGYRCLRLTGVVGDDTGLPGAASGAWDEASEAGGAGMPAPPASDAPARPRRLGLFGFGSAAHLCLQVARWRGREVYAFTRGAKHRDLALELGAVWAGETSDDPGVPLDAAIVFAPAGELAVDALRRLERGGIVALGGIYSTPIPPIEYPCIYHERVIRSVANSTRRDARELLRDAAAIPVHSRTQVYDLEQANEALIDLKEDRVRGSAVLEVSPPGLAS